MVFLKCVGARLYFKGRCILNMQNKLTRRVSLIMALTLTMSTLTACGDNKVETISAEEAGVNVDVKVADVMAMPALTFEELASSNNE